MTDTTAFLSVLRERDIKIWVEADLLKCSAPAGKLDAELRAALSSRKAELLEFLRQAGADDSPDASAPVKSEKVNTSLLPTISREIPLPVMPERRERMTKFADELREAGYDLANCAKRLGVFPRLGVNFWQQMRSGQTSRENDLIDDLIALFIDGYPVSLSRTARQISSTFGGMTPQVMVS
jgi:hypothetical protein